MTLEKYMTIFELIICVAKNDNFVAVRSTDKN